MHEYIITALYVVVVGPLSAFCQMNWIGALVNKFKTGNNIDIETDHKLAPVQNVLQNEVEETTTDDIFYLRINEYFAIGRGHVIDTRPSH